MSRLATFLQRLSFRGNESPPSPSSQHVRPTHFIPEDWYIVETSPGGVERDFVNRKTGESTWYTPEGMTAEEILAIPDAKKYWWTTKQVEKYMKEMAAQKARNGGMDYKDKLARELKEGKVGSAAFVYDFIVAYIMAVEGRTRTTCADNYIGVVKLCWPLTLNVKQREQKHGKARALPSFDLRK
ncbi:hypothetical protein M413DRAFT_14550 [Hebeloma cylindrosporum]|uniref:WW domain-containing protein n=1 Tax=Hebeloma cylindrosporum TaxID=76867 RepID=A0A0C3BVN8_HEBCY|nr:hypothetical protein M413DRAFT_14550 [Hebeloma cylindrosporum h7]